MKVCMAVMCRECLAALTEELSGLLCAEPLKVARARAQSERRPQRHINMYDGC